MSRSRDVANLLNTVDAKGDILVGSADNTVTRLAAGSIGQIPLADSSTTSGLRYVDPPTNRNLIINGAMQVAQRGTSVSSITTSGYRTADRWHHTNNGLGTWTQSVETDAPTGSGFNRSLKMLCTTANASPSASLLAIVNQPLEGQDLQRIRKGSADAFQLSMSFWVKANVTGTYVVELFDIDNSRAVSASYSVTASATWERKVITLPADTTGALDNDNAGSLTANFWLGAGTNWTSGTLATTWGTTSANRAVGQTNLAAATNNYWQITGVQLETGPIATPFEFETYETTLRKCQRYYQRIVPGAAGRYFGHGQSYSTTQTEVVIPYKTVMRTNPTALEQNGTGADYRVGTAGGSSTALSAVPSFVHASDNAITILATVASGQVAGNATPVMAWTATAYLGWSAEL